MLYVCLKSLSYRLWIFEGFDGLIMLIWGFMRVFIGVDIFYSNCSFVCFYCFILLIVIVIWGSLCFDEIYCLFGMECFYGLIIIYCWFGFECVYGFDDIYMYCGFWFGCVYGFIDIIVYCGLIWIWVYLWCNDIYVGFGFKLSVFMVWWYLLFVWI